MSFSPNCTCNLMLISPSHCFPSPPFALQSQTDIEETLERIKQHKGVEAVIVGTLTRHIIRIHPTLV